MKKRMVIVFLGMLCCCSLLLAGCQEKDISGESQAAQESAEAVASPEAATAQSVKEEQAAVTLRTNLAPDYAYEGTYDGWFADVLREQLGICVEFVNSSAEGFAYDKTLGKDFSEMDLYLFLESDGYYDAVKKGKLRNLEKALKKNAKVWKRYSAAFKHIKEDTFSKTGKKGIYAVPMRVQSFEETREGRETYCIGVPTDAKHPGKAMELLTWSASDEGIMNIAFGPEGQMWEKDQGKYVLLQDWFQIGTADPEKKFVETAEGTLDYCSAKCPLYLVGSYALRKELLEEKGTVSDDLKQEATTGETSENEKTEENLSGDLPGESSSEETTVLRTNLAPDYAIDGTYEGWFADLLQEKLGISVAFTNDNSYEGYPVEDGEDTGEMDLYFFWGSAGYYDAVRKGKLRNLEDDLKKNEKVWKRYSKALARIRDDTLLMTDQEGIYAVPVQMNSFEADQKGRETFCISIPMDAKHPEKAMELLSWSASDEGIMNIAFGPEGQMWKKKNGKYQVIQDWYKHPEKKLVQTETGKLSYWDAVCKLTLVGNRELGLELIGKKKS